MKYVLFIVFIATGAVFGHPGGLSELGGHTNRDTGEYHFHRGELAGMTFDSVADALAFSAAEWVWDTSVTVDSAESYRILEVNKGASRCRVVFRSNDADLLIFNSIEYCWHRTMADDLRVISRQGGSEQVNPDGPERFRRIIQGTP